MLNNPNLDSSSLKTNQLKGRIRSVPKGRLRVAQDVSPGYTSHRDQSRRGCPELVERGRLRMPQDGPGFPVQFDAAKEPRAAFREESRIRRRVQSSVQEIQGSPG